jgi:hypothetical protein
MHAEGRFPPLAFIAALRMLLDGWMRNEQRLFGKLTLLLDVSERYFATNLSPRAKILAVRFRKMRK